MDKEFDLKSMEEETNQMLRMRYLDRNNTLFKKTQGGFVSLEMENESYDRVSFYAGFPFADPDRFISVRESNEKAKEIGIIKNLSTDVDTNTASIIREQLGLRYFIPEITKIYNIKDEFGFSYWDVETNRGRCKFAAKMNSSSVVYLTDTRILITDLDDNRFEIPDFTKLSAKELKKLDLFL